MGTSFNTSVTYTVFLGIGNSMISGKLPGIMGESLATFGSGAVSCISASNATLPAPVRPGIQHSNLKNFKKHDFGTGFIINFARSPVRFINFNLYLDAGVMFFPDEP